MEKLEKELLYKQAIVEINAVLYGEKLMVTKMATINSILKNRFPNYFWVGFYCVHKNSLIVGPYQGTLGCIHIPYTKGICGRAARTQTTQIVNNVHTDPEHVACDSRSNSEIVIPVFNHQKKLLAVFDVDSTEFASFDSIDKEYLERIMEYQFMDENLEMIFKLEN